MFMFLNIFLVCPIWLPVFSFFSIIEWTRIWFLYQPGMDLRPFPSSVWWDEIWTHNISIVNLVCYPLDQAFNHIVYVDIFHGPLVKERDTWSIVSSQRSMSSTTRQLSGAQIFRGNLSQNVTWEIINMFFYNWRYLLLLTSLNKILFPFVFFKFLAICKYKVLFQIVDDFLLPIFAYNCKKNISCTWQGWSLYNFRFGIAYKIPF